MVSVVMAVLLVVANVLGTVMIVPQSVRLSRRGSSDGVSETWVGVGVAMNLWWLAYGLHGGLLGVIPVSVATAGLYGYMAVQLWRLSGPNLLRPFAIGLFGLGSIPLPFLIFDGWARAGVAIGLCYGVQFAPAAITAVSSTRPSGISPVTWSMAAVEAAIWLAYGLSIDDLALTIGGATGAAMSAIILVRLWLLGPLEPTRDTTVVDQHLLQSW